VLADAGITFGASVSVVGGDNNDVIVRADGEDASISLDLDVANAIVVKRASAL
jgi:iron-dependent repressor ideR